MLIDILMLTNGQIFIFQVVGEGGAIRESGTSGTMTELTIRDVRPLN